MSDDSNRSSGSQNAKTGAGAAKPKPAAKRYQPKHATRVVPMERDGFGRMCWKSFHTPASFEVRAEAQIPPHLPGVIIFVHGVNSEGEWYEAAEKALCEGLNKRLNRGDLEPNTYLTHEDGHPIQRKLDPNKPGYSPVIRFYWGYRAKSKTDTEWRIPLRNIEGGDFWKQKDDDRDPWFWGGGPFQNGTNNLQQLWSKKGFCKKIAGVSLQAFNTEWDRELHDAPPRNYNAHAAQRLADLIDKIRNGEEKNGRPDTITIMSHSQGTMVAMAATMLCKTRAPDALIVMNSPFALEDKITDALTCGNERPTEEARVKTFIAIARRIKDQKHIHTEAELQQLHVGATEDMQLWRPDVAVQNHVRERDNHGRLYVYFNPHDRVMGSAPLQSIGWKGLDDKLLTELEHSVKDTVKQRMLARGTPCGGAGGITAFGKLPRIPNPEPGVSPDDFWNGNRRALGMLLWTVPSKSHTVTINAEEVPNPISAEEMSETFFMLARTASGDKVRWAYFDESRSDQNMLGAKWSDGPYMDSDFTHLDSVSDRKWIEREDVYSSSGKSRGLESEEERHKRIAEYQPMPTNHSTLPMHEAFISRVVAYDLPIGFCDAYEKPENFWSSLIRDADWTQATDCYYSDGELLEIPKPSGIAFDTVAEAITKADQERGKWSGA
jgi:pimeloyl-ACP methyl ester carboxylesterase